MRDACRARRSAIRKNASRMGAPGEAPRISDTSGTHQLGSAQARIITAISAPVRRAQASSSTSQAIPAGSSQILGLNRNVAIETQHLGA